MTILLHVFPRWFPLLLGLLSLGAPLRADDISDADEKYLKQQKVATDGPGLLQYLRAAGFSVRL